MLSKNKRVIVWGIGQLTMKLLVETSLAKAEIVAFVDSNPINKGKILNGVRVIAPEELNGIDEQILISSTLHQLSITLQIKKMGLKNDLIVLKH
jgi:FlaA1/EpsC-like NDP-sugar epimerase